MRKFILKRVAFTVFALFLVSIIAFSITYVLPEDPAWLIAGPRATEEQVEAIRKAWGMDQPIPVQWLRWLVGWPSVDPKCLESYSPMVRELASRFIPRGVLRGDLGWSLRLQAPVSELVLRYLPSTFAIVGLAAAISLAGGFLVGIIPRRKLLDSTGKGAWFILVSMPIGWVSLLLILALVIRLRVLGTDSLIIPAVCLALVQTAMVGRAVRLDMGKQRFKRVKAAARSVIRSALVIIPRRLPLFFSILIFLGLFFEVGIGHLYFRPYPDLIVLGGIFLTIASLILLINLVCEIAYAYLKSKGVVR